LSPYSGKSNAIQNVFLIQLDKKAGKDGSKVKKNDFGYMTKGRKTDIQTDN
jgi:hypothetical protein